MNRLSIKTQYYLGAAIILMICCVGASWYQYMNLQHQAITSVYNKTEIFLSAASSIRSYVKDNLRPKIRESLTSDQFILEAMSTSYISRQIMNNLKKSYPEFIYKRAANNPRNFVNKADEFENKMLRWFSNHREKKQWEGMIKKEGGTFYVRMTPIWAEHECLVCHGNPVDAPKEMLDLYGTEHSYGFTAGDIVGADTIYIPMDSTNLLIKEKTAWVFLFGFISLFSLFALFALLFNRTVVQQLKRLLLTLKSIHSDDRQETEIKKINSSDEFTQIKDAIEIAASNLKSVHDELKSSETKYKALFQASPDAIFVCDSQGMLTDLNKAGVSLFRLGEPEEYTADVQFKDLFYSGTEAMKVFDILRNGSSIVNAEYKLVTKSGELITCLVSANRLLDEETDFIGIEGVFRDVTEERKLSKHLAQTEKMASVGQLAAGIAHEINNPLGVILCYGDLILKNRESSSQIQEDTQVIQKHANSCKTIVESLLNFARVSDTQMKKADIHECLNEILSVLQNQMKKQNITVLANLDSNIEDIVFDEDKIKQVFMNLLLNSIQAMPEGGDLNLVTQLNLKKKQIMIIMADSGYGIPDDKLDIIFEPFFTTKERGKGTGLGLSVSYGIIQQHNGNLSVSSQPGTGTTFYITLPVDYNNSLTSAV
ncbi:MAG: DUF3365 domain-containing protein [Deltaproteobacteria bacterium]|nr:DUF3365 domain-containing protein [Deltaproteobacteria bacterium]MBT6615021.1 DUF3365 domain-containing protein [Deltaproteobacteria bacterium]